jgi:hypothetical protein
MSPVRFFIDRSLGAHLIPAALRRAGWDIVTMRERYGEVSGQALSDIDWVRDAAEAGEAILTKDDHVATRPAEARTIYMCDARVFAFTKADLTADQMIDILLAHAEPIHRWAARTRGPYVATLRASLPIRRRRLNYPS